MLNTASDISVHLEGNILETYQRRAAAALSCSSASASQCRETGSESEEPSTETEVPEETTPEHLTRIVGPSHISFKLINTLHI